MIFISPPVGAVQERRKASPAAPIPMVPAPDPSIWERLLTIAEL